MIGITKVCVYISHCAWSRRVGFSFLPVPHVIVIEVFPAKPTLAVKIHRNIVMAGTNCACLHVYGAVIVAGRVRDISLSIAVACSANEYVCADCPRFGRCRSLSGLARSGSAFSAHCRCQRKRESPVRRSRLRQRQSTQAFILVSSVLLVWL